MLKVCNVILNNEAVTVIREGGYDVQIPAIHREAKTVKVLIEQGKYIVVPDSYEEQDDIMIEKNEKKYNKKTTEKNVKEKSKVDKEIKSTDDD